MKRVSPILLLALLPGCMSAQVFEYRGGMRPPRSAGAPRAPVAINPLSFPRTRVQVVRAHAPTQMVGDVRFAALDEHLFRLNEAAGTGSSVRRSSDLDPAAANRSGYVVQYAVRSYQSGQITDGGGLAAALIIAILSGGVAMLSLCAVTVASQHRFEAAVRVYRAADASLAVGPSAVTGERVAQFDIGSARPIFSETYDLEIESGWASCSEPTGADRHRLDQQEGRQMAWRIFEVSREGVRAAMVRADRQRAASLDPRPATAGGSAPPRGSPSNDAEAALRAHLDARASAILGCLDADSAAVHVRWSPSEVSVRGVDDETLLGCVRAALGQLPIPPGSPSGEVLHFLQR